MNVCQNEKPVINLRKGKKMQLHYLETGVGKVSPYSWRKII